MIHTIRTYKKSLFFILTGSCTLFLLYVFLPWYTAPAIKDSTRIYDASGSLLYEVHSTYATSRKRITYQDIPPHFVEALIASEDQRFFRHHGVDLEGTLRATQSTLFGQKRSGGSTITQQLMKITYYPESSRTILQKMREMTASMVYEVLHPKEEILTHYLNNAYFGAKSYGLFAASETYFGKVPQELSLSESAYLVSKLPNPEGSSPWKSPEDAQAGKHRVLLRMEEEGFLDAARRASLEEEALIFHTTEKRKAPHFVDFVVAEALKTYPDLKDGGYEIYTTLQSGWQEDAQQSIEKQLTFLQDKHISNAGMVVIEPATGAIQVMVGGVDYDKEDGGKYNVTLAKRQPGSSLKPFTYLTAFMQGANPTDIIYDIASSFPTANGDLYSPKNYDLKYHGPVSLATSLGSSLNIPAVQTLHNIGLENFFHTLQLFGLVFPERAEHYGLGITLGGGEVRLLDLTHAYSMLANGGKKTSPFAIKIVKKNGSIIFEHKSSQQELFPGKQDILEQAIYLVSYILRTNAFRTLSFGASNRLHLTDYVAVKTGTTKDYHDNWAFGYTPYLTAGVWVGNNDNTPMEGVSGISGAVPIWSDFMRRREDEVMRVTEKDWHMPSGIIHTSVCTLSGMKASHLCANVINAPFIAGNEPQKEDTWIQNTKNHKETGLLYKASCAGTLMERPMIHIPAILQEWADSVHMTTAPFQYCDNTYKEAAAEDLFVTSPQPSEVFFIDPSKPLDGQSIPLSISGQGIYTEAILLDGKELTHNKILPLKVFLKPSVGNHVITIGTQHIPFSITELP